MCQRHTFGAGGDQVLPAGAGIPAFAGVCYATKH
jgi:hypothetical protein